MNIGDIIALAKQGYKPADIKELLNMAEPTPAEPLTDVAEEKGEQPAPMPAAVVEKTEDDADKDILITQLQNQIKELQQANTRISRPAEEPKDYAADLNEIARKFM